MADYNNKKPNPNSNQKDQLNEKVRNYLMGIGSKIQSWSDKNRSQSLRGISVQQVVYGWMNDLGENDIDRSIYASTADEAFDKLEKLVAPSADNLTKILMKAADAKQWWNDLAEIRQILANPTRKENKDPNYAPTPDSTNQYWAYQVGWYLEHNVPNIDTAISSLRQYNADLQSHLSELQDTSTYLDNKQKQYADQITKKSIPIIHSDNGLNIKTVEDDLRKEWMQSHDQIQALDSIDDDLNIYGTPLTDKRFRAIESDEDPNEYKLRDLIWRAWRSEWIEQEKQNDFSLRDIRKEWSNINAILLATELIDPSYPAGGDLVSDSSFRQPYRGEDEVHYNISQQLWAVWHAAYVVQTRLQNEIKNTHNTILTFGDDLWKSPPYVYDTLVSDSKFRSLGKDDMTKGIYHLKQQIWELWHYAYLYPVHKDSIVRDDEARILQQLNDVVRQLQSGQIDVSRFTGDTEIQGTPLRADQFRKRSPSIESSSVHASRQMIWMLYKKAFEQFLEARNKVQLQSEWSELQSKLMSTPVLKAGDVIYGVPISKGSFRAIEPDEDKDAYMLRQQIWVAWREAWLDVQEMLNYLRSEMPNVVNQTDDADLGSLDFDGVSLQGSNFRAIDPSLDSSLAVYQLRNLAWDELKKRYDKRLKQIDDHNARDSETINALKQQIESVNTADIATAMPPGVVCGTPINASDFRDIILKPNHPQYDTSGEVYALRRTLWEAWHKIWSKQQLSQMVGVLFVHEIRQSAAELSQDIQDVLGFINKMSNDQVVMAGGSQLFDILVDMQTQFSETLNLISPDKLQDKNMIVDHFMSQDGKSVPGRVNKLCIQLQGLSKSIQETIDRLEFEKTTCADIIKTCTQDKKLPDGFPMPKNASQTAIFAAVADYIDQKVSGNLAKYPGIFATVKSFMLFEATRMYINAEI